ncbi:MAG: hypothetical protein EPN30_03050 [Actinomycetota bacterium]|nr:MAG: hypothetical protein EPN30_03050 [Actinomycetota bacterium]
MEVEIEGNQGNILGYLSQSSPKAKHSGQGSQTLILNFGMPVAKPVAGTDLFHKELVERIANQSGWTVLSILCSGIDGSAGRFSPMNWCSDLEATASYMTSGDQAKSALLVGYDFAATTCLYVASRLEFIRGVATISPVFDLSAYSNSPQLLAHQAQSVGIKVPTKSSEIDSWTKELEELDPAKSAELIGSKQWLVIHGRDDEIVTDADLREFLTVSGVAAEVHTLTAGEHQLISDPRMMAILLGWMERNN